MITPKNFRKHHPEELPKATTSHGSLVGWLAGLLSAALLLVGCPVVWASPKLTSGRRTTSWIGSADRMPTCVTVCYPESPCVDEGAIGITVTLPTGTTDNFMLIRRVRGEDSKYTYPDRAMTFRSRHKC
jgi:hypothetical protein